jgi:hypothetical protein
MLKSDVKVIKFADDTKGEKAVRSVEDRDELQRVLDCLCDRAKKWAMSFNISKCKTMHVGLHNPGYEDTMRGIVISKIEEERDVGVAVTKNLKPSARCSKAAGRAAVVL